MAITSQVRLLRAMGSILNGNGVGAFPESSEPKPVFRKVHESTPLPRSSPEAEGLSSAMLEDFYRTVSAMPTAGVHSLLVLRHGKVISEGYFAPFQKDVWHVTHSLCKTITGTAVGLAIAEGLFTLDDTVVDFFPDKTGLLLSKKMRSITVRHLLTMTSGISYNEIDEAVDTDWLKGMFASNVVFEPGSRFMYNSMNSYLLSALVQTTSGQTVTEFLTPRLFEPMGFGPVGAEKSAAGIEKGGWGMYLLAEDMAKLGQLYLQEGMWNGEQLVPAGWIHMATEAHIEGDKGERYGYHLWVDGDDGAYIMNGMFGQYITVLPRLDMVLVMTAGNPHVFTDAPVQELVRNTFYPMPTPPDSLPESPLSLGSLRRTLAKLTFGQPLPPPSRLPARVPARTRAQRWNNLRGEIAPAGNPGLDSFLGATWQFGKNHGGLLPVIVQVMDNNFSSGVSALHLEREDDDTLLMLWEEDQGTVCIPLGLYTHKRSHFYMGRESFEAAALCNVRQDELGQPVLLIEVCLLEHSSCRFIKLKRIGERLQISMDEQPNLMVAVETVMQQTQNTNSPGAKSDPTGGLLNFDYVSHRINRVCTPVVTGERIQ